MNKGLQIDFETADRITLLCLKEQLDYLREELRQHQYENQYMHSEDVANTVKLIPALELIIKHYGG